MWDTTSTASAAMPALRRSGVYPCLTAERPRGTPDQFLQLRFAAPTQAVEDHSVEHGPLSSKRADPWHRPVDRMAVCNFAHGVEDCRCVQADRSAVRGSDDVAKFDSYGFDLRVNTRRAVTAWGRIPRLGTDDVGSRSIAGLVGPRQRSPWDRRLKIT